MPLCFSEQYNPRNLRTDSQYQTTPLAYLLLKCCEVLELPFEKGTKDAEVGHISY